MKQTKKPFSVLYTTAAILLLALLLFTNIPTERYFERFRVAKDDLKIRVEYRPDYQKEKSTKPAAARSYRKNTDRPDYAVNKADAAKLKKLLSEKYPGIKTNAVEFGGTTPSDYFSFTRQNAHIITEREYDFGTVTVYGKVTGTTKKYGSVYPVFAASYMQKQILPRNLPLRLFAAVFVFVFILLIRYILRNTNHSTFHNFGGKS